MPGLRNAARPIDVDLPITPMLDMSFQLLAFFVFTFKPMSAEGQLAMNLPQTPIQNPVQPAAPWDNDPDEYRVVVSVADGAISNIAVHGPTGVTLIGGAADARLKALIDNLRAAQRGFLGPRPPVVKIEAPDTLRYAHLIQLMDACRRAGFDTIGIGPRS